MAHIPQILAPRLTLAEKAALKQFGRRFVCTDQNAITALVQLRLLEIDNPLRAYRLTDFGQAVLNEVILDEWTQLQSQSYCA